jgi:hypothetical protein
MVKHCYLCKQEGTRRRYGREALAAGDTCPVCYQPTCRRHLTVVRWRWKESGEADAALVCKECQRTYAHRHWDTLHREWIT